jgi:hypothetical protein
VKSFKWFLVSNLPARADNIQMVILPFYAFPPVQMQNYLGESRTRGAMHSFLGEYAERKQKPAAVSPTR